ncbi:Ig-like domain repeat protein [Prescottella agglutinans]|uniref:Ig-like domain repeat protein n=1 Tax=Prescottella agglutinans TaxID=1644129 RepID=A0A438B7I1_9NOCA|nr:Ig-like domain-containing protein [Prescottella agglutinans]RVW06921.1 Ig-like domain repeat protein [Prescottella agglutinans]
MSDRRFRRIIGGVGAVAVAAGFVATVGVGSAGAASGSVTWDDGNSRYTRTVSNTTPNEGDIVTVSTKFERTGIPVEYIYAVKDLHPTCMTYVDGSAKVDGSPRGLQSQAADYARIQGSSIDWPVYPNINPKSHTFEFSYRVGADCDRGVPLMTTMHYSGSLGDGTYSNKGPAITVAKNASSTSLAAVSGAQVGKPVTLSATVTGAAQGDSVDFYDGGAKVGSGALNGSGAATFTWTPSTAGARSVQAKFPGSARANGSDSTVQSVQVAAPDAATSTSVQAPATATAGVPVTLTATVAPATTAGTVQFKDGTANIGAPVAVSNGVASLDHTFTAAGGHDITAVYSGAPGFSGSTSSPAQTVTVRDPDVATTTTLQVPPTAELGAAVTFTATVDPATAAGTVQFKDGAGDIGAPVTVSNGKAQLSHTFTVAGNHSISAVFTGSTGFLGSTAAARNVIATNPPTPDVQTSTALTVQPTAQTGATVALTASVTPSNAAGTVQFADNGTAIGGPVTVSNGAASLQHAFTTAGSHSITAVFTPGAGFAGSSAPAQSVQVSDPAPSDVATTTELTGPGTATVGQVASLSARVTGAAQLTGTVQFYDGETPLGAAVPVINGVAVLDHTFATSGAHVVKAVYSGGAGSLASTSAPQTVQVTVAGGGDGGTGSAGSLGTMFGSLGG